MAKFIIHYGYFECDGLTVCNSIPAAKTFIKKKKKEHKNPANFFYEIFKAKSWEKVTIDESK